LYAIKAQASETGARPTATYWGVGVVRVRKEPAVGSYDPEGHNYTIRALGLRAYLLISDMWKRNLSGAKKRQWNKTVLKSGL
jgi:hypothetical protein